MYPVTAQSEPLPEYLAENYSEIVNLQTKLNDLGFDAGPADGVWGQRSSSAFDDFITRFPEIPNSRNEIDPIQRLYLVSESWFGSPFADDGPLFRETSPLTTRLVFTSDIRASQIECEDCSVTTFILGAGDFDADGADELLVGQNIDREGRPQDIATPLLVLDKVETGNAELLSLIDTDNVIARVHAREAAISDFNGDGIDDFFIAAHGLDRHPFPGEQNILVMSTPDGPKDFSGTNIPQINDMAHGAEAGDVDGDGDIDIVVITNDGLERYEPYVLLNDGLGNFEKRALESFVGHPEVIQLYRNGHRENSFSSARLIDLNKDELPELILLRGDRSFTGRYTQSHIFWNLGQGLFSTENLTNLPTDRWSSNTYTNDADAMDLNGDGLLDLILTQSTRLEDWRGQFVQVLLQTENGSFVDDTASRIWPQGYPVQLEDVLFADETEISDLNGDGFPDLITRSLGPAMRSSGLGEAIVQIGINDGSGYFQPVDPRWVSGNREYRFRGPIPGNFGPEGGIGLISYSVYGVYNNSRDVTWGAKFFLHLMPAN